MSPDDHFLSSFHHDRVSCGRINGCFGNHHKFRFAWVQVETDIHLGNQQLGLHGYRAQDGHIEMHITGPSALLFSFGKTRILSGRQIEFALCVLDKKIE